MKAADFNFSRDLKFNIQTGITTFKDSRLIILDANAMGLLRQKLLDTLGPDKARELLLQFGYQNGYSDFVQTKLAYRFDSEMDLLATGPVLHTWEGIVLATPKPEARIDRQKGEFFFPVVWKNSYEAEQHLCFNKPAQQPVCWTLMGYASGWASAFVGKRILAIESSCAGKGDAHCEVLLQPEPAWGKEAAPYIAAYKEFNA
ncbi:MAG TPA: XylR N-terminal domain-containing protein [Terriglobales bacterium]|nr:XylR N-terminal domain-containing protein [Terriglobales bacterium]